jgi:hypothetical protein
MRSTDPQSRPARTASRCFIPLTRRGPSVAAALLAWASLAFACSAALSAATTLSVTTENPCFLDPSTEKCSVGLAWSTDSGSGKVTVRVQNHNVTSTVVSCQNRGVSDSTTFNHVRATPKTVEIFVTDATSCASNAALDALIPDVSIGVMGVSEPLIALQQQCILRGSATQCSTPVQWLAETDATYPSVQIRTTPSLYPSPPGTVWRCNTPSTDTVYQDDYALAPFNGHLLTAYRAACCPADDTGSGCSDDLDSTPLGSVVVRGVPELRGVWLMPNLLIDSDVSLSQDPDAAFTAEGDTFGNKWMQHVVTSDSDEQGRRDIQLIAELRRIADDGFNMVMFPLQSGVIPWPDTENTTSPETVSSILGDIEDALDHIVHVVKLAEDEGLMVGFNLQHHCVYSNAAATANSCSHIGGTTGFPECGTDNVDTALDWHEAIFDYLESELTAAELRYIVELAPVAHANAPGGGDPSGQYTITDNCHEEVEEYLRRVIPELQAMTDIPIVMATKPQRFKTDPVEQYEPVQNLMATVPNYLVDFLDVTSYYEDQKFAATAPFTIDPDPIVDALGSDYASKLILSDYNIRNLLDEGEFEELTEEEQHDLALERAPCNIKFHLDEVPVSGSGLAGTWFLGHRAAYNGSPTWLGVRERSCVPSGSLTECDFNADDEELLEYFETPSCSP